MSYTMDKGSSSLKIAVSLGVVFTCLSFFLREMPQSNLAPLGFSLVIFMTGQSKGARHAWATCAIAILFNAGLLAAHFINPSIFYTSVFNFAIFAVYPVLELRKQEAASLAFQKTLEPLKNQQQNVRGKLSSLQENLEEIRRRVKDNELLFHVSLEISKILTMSDMLQLFKDTISATLARRENTSNKLLDSVMFLLLLMDEEKNKFTLGCSSGLSEDLAGSFENRVGERDLMNWLYEQKQPVYISDVHQANTLEGVPIPKPIKSFLSIPLVYRDEVIGMIFVFDIFSNAFDQHDFNNFVILGNQIAIGIEKALLYEKVQRLSITDGLTNLFVHRYLQERLDAELRRAERYSSKLSFLMLDIDHFKKYNDTYGHLAGDEVLRRVARILVDNMDGVDILARYGGEEFAVIMPDQDKEAAFRKAEALRAAVEKEQFIFEGRPTGVTISCGLATFPGDAMTKKGLIERADQALYQSKSKGRNRITLAS